MHHEKGVGHRRGPEGHGMRGQKHNRYMPRWGSGSARLGAWCPSCLHVASDDARDNDPHAVCHVLAKALDV
jgi:hypothetical protein